MKKCPRCKQTLPLTEFKKRPNGGPDAYCKPCRHEYDADYHWVRRHEVNERRKGRIKERRVFLRNFFEEVKDVPCLDCGVRYPPYVMHFDHLSDKVFNISNASSLGVSMSRLRAEIAKTEIVCANCHAIRTHKRRTECNSLAEGRAWDSEAGGSIPLTPTITEGDAEESNPPVLQTGRRGAVPRSPTNSSHSFTS